MSSFFDRLREYYMQVGKVLRGEAAAASIFPNTTDIGTSREKVYGEILKLHAPSGCNVMYGGFLFDQDGKESKQMDIIVTNHSSMQFNLFNKDMCGKSFACIDGCIAVVSVKSTLDGTQLQDALGNLSTIPDKMSIEGKKSPMISIDGYTEWPYKVIYASDGISLEALLEHLTAYFKDHPEIPMNKKPDIIHVAGKYCVVKVGEKGGTTRDGTKIEPNTFFPMSDATDVYALYKVLSEIQGITTSSQHIYYNYIDMINKFTF